jgi:hypothetical protein
MTVAWDVVARGYDRAQQPNDGHDGWVGQQGGEGAARCGGKGTRGNHLRLISVGGDGRWR